MRDPSGRLLHLLSLLQSPREWTGVELAERLRVTARTIRRDIERLRELGYPVHATQGNIGGYRLVAGAALPPLVLDDEEAVAIAVGLRTGAMSAVTGIEDASLRALAKLEQVLPGRLRRRVSDLSQADVLPTGGGAEVDPEILAGLAAACRAHEKVRFTHIKPGGEITRRFAEPHRLVAAGSRWYLIAFDDDRSDWRTFRLDRISAIHRTGVRVPERELPDGMDGASWLTRSLRRTGTVQARLLLHEPIDVARRHVGARQGMLEPADEQACILTTYPDAPRYVAFNIVLLPMPYTLLDPPELVPLVRAIAERALDATGSGPTAPSC
ncbi:helix-turn-helix transcriptional regulator [Nocardia mexicana]|uniref:Putative DNA-binding transcriptional regulator YafY n=1 Tax=Nocardia mexicana TaxID=279262 RepID=A0A370GFR2_9NOCA|nr:WYL domain-containing protein [Nocardia mexicana]RDI42638.1 putative DNA-binding transcriptional regulator YafY [Nocardia mexicana]